jgi:CopG family nickel-responsive transcriptional regulator
MPELIRLSLSIEKPLFERLERLAKQSGYTNRSEFVRDMVRQRLVQSEWEKDREVLGTITLIYNHHQRQLSEKLIHLQHHHHAAVKVTTHVHLSRDLCAEVIVVQARASQVRELTDLLRRQKGVLHADLTMSSTGVSLD